VLTCFLAVGYSTAQTSGTISFEEKVKLDIQIDDADPAILKDIPKERILAGVLYFNTQATLYQEDKSRSTSGDITSDSEEGGRMMIRMDKPDDKVFCDLNGKMKIEQRELMTRKFLIESPLDQQKWKLTGNQKMILGYACQEALLIDTVKKVSAWFAPAIPVPSGPNGYANLPGMILAVDVDSGKIVFTATEIKETEIEKSILKKPSEGKKVSKDEYKKIVDEKRKEMEAENGGKGDIIIKIRK